MLLLETDLEPGLYFYNDKWDVEIIDIINGSVKFHLAPIRDGKGSVKYLKSPAFKRFLVTNEFVGVGEWGSYDVHFDMDCDCGARFTSMPEWHYDWCKTQK